MFKIKVTGNSMEPTMVEGNLYDAEEISTNVIKIGDVILFKKQKTNIVAHRVIKIIEMKNKRVFSTKGDNNLNKVNEIVYENEILGRVIV